MSHGDLALPKVERYGSAAAEPSDFDPFWQGILRQAPGHELAATFRPHPSVFSHPESFDVGFSGCCGHRAKATLRRVVQRLQRRVRVVPSAALSASATGPGRISDCTCRCPRAMTGPTT